MYQVMKRRRHVLETDVDQHKTVGKPRPTLEEAQRLRTWQERLLNAAQDGAWFVWIKALGEDPDCVVYDGLGRVKHNKVTETQARELCTEHDDWTWHKTRVKSPTKSKRNKNQ